MTEDIATVQEGLQTLSQREHLVTLDELMSRRGHNHRDLRHMVAVWRQERLAWKNNRDKLEARREGVDE